MMCSASSQRSKQNVASFLSTAISQAPGPLRSALGTDIIAAEHFNFSWRALVEHAVLDQGIANQPLNKIPLAPEARVNFGEATLAFNWNQLPHWDDTNRSTCSKWFLKNKKDGQHVQYPLYATALYKRKDDGVEFEVQMQGKPMHGLFELCSKKKDDFCLESHGASEMMEVFESITETVSSWWIHSTAPTLNQSKCDDFSFKPLTVGQVASASSAAVGAGAVQPWVQSLIELVRQKAKDILKGGSLNVWYCAHYRMLIENFVGPCNRQFVLDEFLKLLGCETSDGQIHDSATTAKRWAAFLQKMAIEMTVENGHSGHMAIDAGYNDNSGLAPIVSQFLRDESKEGQILVLVINAMGDNQVKEYFDSTAKDGGIICQAEVGMEKVFAKMKGIQQKSFQDLGGEYIERNGNEKTCAMRLPPTAFFEGYPPKQQRFADRRIPAHITYAYTKGAPIVKNDDFYAFPNTESKNVDLLFVIANAPVPTVSLPDAGSGSYVGLANSMELAMEELSGKFPSFFVEQADPSTQDSIGDAQATPDVGVDRCAANIGSRNKCPNKSRSEATLVRSIDLIESMVQFRHLTQKEKEEIIDQAVARHGKEQIEKELQSLLTDLQQRVTNTMDQDPYRGFGENYWWV